MSVHVLVQPQYNDIALFSVYWCLYVILIVFTSPSLSTIFIFPANVIEIFHGPKKIYIYEQTSILFVFKQPYWIPFHACLNKLTLLNVWMLCQHQSKSTWFSHMFRRIWKINFCPIFVCAFKWVKFVLLPFAYFAFKSKWREVTNGYEAFPNPKSQQIRLISANDTV